MNKDALHDLSDAVCEMYQSVINQTRKNPCYNSSKPLELIGKIQNASSLYYVIISDRDAAIAQKELMEIEIKTMRFYQTQMAIEISQLKSEK